MSCDPEHRFDLALQLGELKTAYSLAVESEVSWVYNHSYALDNPFGHRNSFSKMSFLNITDACISYAYNFA